MKKMASPGDSSDTLIDTSDEDDVTTTSEESSDTDDTDTSEDKVPIRRRKSKSKKPRAVLCKKETDSDSSAAKDALPHPTCQCDGCVKGRRILKAVIKFDAKKNAAEKQSRDEGKGGSKGVKDDASSTEASTEATDTTEAGTTEPETTEPETTNDKTPPKKGKKQKQQQKKNQNQNQEQNSPPKEDEKAAPRVEEAKRAVNKEAWKMPAYPKEMQPNWVMPPRTKVMRIEHTIENENDPRPNAFFDSGKGITRVYHGPMFGNHMGELYAKYNNDQVKSSGLGPSGWPQFWQGNSQNVPWFIPGPPQGSPCGLNMPNMNAQMPSGEDAMREAASKGFGLSGMPPPHPPPMNKEETQKAAWKKAGSDKASENNVWGGAANFNTGAAEPGWGGASFGNDNNSKFTPLINACPNSLTHLFPLSQDNSWGPGADWATGGGTFGPKKDGVSSPANFAAFGSNNGAKFERRKLALASSSIAQKCD